MKPSLVAIVASAVSLKALPTSTEMFTSMTTLATNQRVKKLATKMGTDPRIIKMVETFYGDKAAVRLKSMASGDLMGLLNSFELGKDSGLRDIFNDISGDSFDWSDRGGFDLSKLSETSDLASLADALDGADLNGLLGLGGGGDTVTFESISDTMKKFAEENGFGLDSERTKQMTDNANEFKAEFEKATHLKEFLEHTQDDFKDSNGAGWQGWRDRLNSEEGRLAKDEAQQLFDFASTQFNTSVQNALSTNERDVLTNGMEALTDISSDPDYLALLEDERVMKAWSSLTGVDLKVLKPMWAASKAAAESGDPKQFWDSLFSIASPPPPSPPSLLSKMWDMTVSRNPLTNPMTKGPNTFTDKVVTSPPPPAVIKPIDRLIPPPPDMSSDQVTQFEAVKREMAPHFFIHPDFSRMTSEEQHSWREERYRQVQDRFREFLSPTQVKAWTNKVYLKRTG
eukprot:CAMPEP_0119328916 /NCGR_PEP_ID=MMETSP1333-20130426/74572_1 /TAXON_ID=418940 /ORGANISM="Scyphosphaera apsteinii, Strain RCC1455" /LENGTH=454 /DNA_ID=CAMNT_0007337905 /DNA_START=21 /DNA_END=1385 /DNA_ORIENTATION=+